MVRVRADAAGFAVIAPDLRTARETQRIEIGSKRAGFAVSNSEIELCNVSFRYSADRPMAVRDISLRIPGRAFVGLVGANGSGKTTVMDLIAGVLPPACGSVMIDGSELDAQGRAAWRQRVAYVPQNVALLDSSIATNIAFTTQDGDIDRPRMLWAARLASLDEFVATLPGGYEFRIGERGVELSGGQRQRIGIARALYREATVLLLDEATNELDGLTEEELLATLGRLRGRYTTVMIAHRLSTVRGCDLIYELDSGAVACSGTFEQLLDSPSGLRRLAGVR
jgi:ABC-type bacteriocin/lantibiotic exporter with double-glycine peptidase domain